MPLWLPDKLSAGEGFIMRWTRVAVTTLILTTMLSMGAIVRDASAQEKANRLELGDGKVTLSAPKDWQRKQPRTSIVEYEFAVPAAKGDALDGRMTVMAAGGGIDANVERWYGQFTQPDGGSTRDRAKVKKQKIGGEEVHIVDLSGTYKDQAGPMAPATERPKYRMLAAIIPVKDAGTYYFKFYGPERTVAEQEKAFLSMIEGLERK
jgi:hypothetical protein